MKEDAGQTLARQWAMLRGIPRAPYTSTVTALAESLLDQGFKVSRRTIERDLHVLSGRFPLMLDDRSKPYGWSWMKDANFEFMPGLTPPQAVALLLAKTHLRSLLPQNMHRDLVPVFDTAERAIASSGWKDWHKRTAVVPSTLVLLPPKFDARVMGTVQTALARGHSIDARYRAKGRNESESMRIHPLGLLMRGPVIYVVCTLFEYRDIRQLALHRLSDASSSGEPRRDPDQFDFSKYASTTASSFHSTGFVRLVAWFDAPAAEHLLETPVSSDQTWRPLVEGKIVEITATVEDDDRLRWWLLAFGSQVEVREPAELRRDIKADLVASFHQYND